MAYDIEFLTAEKMMVASYMEFCSNNRVATIFDPNTGIAFWKSGTIVEYIEDVYDHDAKLDYINFPEMYYLEKHLKDYEIAGHLLFLGQKAYSTM
ncbi:hypothetical protein J1614_003386 [Plenodomus biglobosus]|nr:hypothetical protein J1614_003386 [Plenodomus biglobosus]